MPTNAPPSSQIVLLQCFKNRRIRTEQISLMWNPHGLLKLPRNKICANPTRQGPEDQYTVGEIDEDSTRRLLGVPAPGKTNADHPPPTILAFRITVIHI